MNPKVTKVLVLCTGNSCRSVMAEALINALGHGLYQAWSAGSHPTGSVHPKSIKTLTRHGIDPGHPRSKSWSELANHTFDLVITVCDQAAGESCPLFPGSQQSCIGARLTQPKRLDLTPKSSRPLTRLFVCSGSVSKS